MSHSVFGFGVLIIPLNISLQAINCINCSNTFPIRIILATKLNYIHPSIFPTIFYSAIIGLIEFWKFCPPWFLIWTCFTHRPILLTGAWEFNIFFCVFMSFLPCINNCNFHTNSISFCSFLSCLWSNVMYEPSNLKWSVNKL